MISITQKIMNRIRKKGRGWVFTPKDFVDLTGRKHVGVILHRLLAKGWIRKVGRGLYDFPRHHAVLGAVPASAAQIAAAIARASGDRLLPTGAQAANDLGLTTQVPARMAFVTTGKPKTIHVDDKLDIQFRRNILPPSLTHDMAYLTLQALNNIGPKDVDSKMIARCAKRLSDDDRADIRHNVRYIRNPWLAGIARQLITEGNRTSR